MKERYDKQICYWQHEEDLSTCLLKMPDERPILTVDSQRFSDLVLTSAALHNLSHSQIVVASRESSLEILSVDLEAPLYNPLNSGQKHNTKKHELEGRRKRASIPHIQFLCSIFTSLNH